MISRCIYALRWAAIVLATTALVPGCGSTTASDQGSTVATGSTTTVADSGRKGAGTVTVVGDVRKSTNLTFEALRKFPPHQESVSFRSSNGIQNHTYVGAALIDIVTAADPAVDSADEHALLSVAILATGADGYSAAVAWGEISPDFAATPVLVAYTEDDHDLDQPRLVVPGDVKGARYVSDLTELRIVDLTLAGGG